MTLEDFVLIVIGIALTALLGGALVVEAARLLHPAKPEPHPLARRPGTGRG